MKVSTAGTMHSQRPCLPVGGPRLWLATWSLLRRELVRFFRQRSRIVGALGTPILFWFVLGSGFGESLRGPGLGGGGNYLVFAFPGVAAMIALFTSIFSAMSTIDDRQNGFLQGVLASPAGRSAVALGKILGATLLATGQAGLFCLAAPLVGIPLSLVTLASAIAMIAIVAVGLASLGFVIAWSMESTQGFHAIMNLVLMPMWLLSGAVFPSTGATGWVQWVMAVNPLTYGVSAIRFALNGCSAAAGVEPPWEISVGASIAFAAVMVALSIYLATRRA